MSSYRDASLHHKDRQAKRHLSIVSMSSTELERATGSLAALCRRSFGPCGEETLLFRAPEAPVVTGEGHAVLSAWTRGVDRHQPLVKFLLDAVSGVHRQLGDGSSEFILLLDAAVRRANDWLGGENTARHQVDRSMLARAFGELKWELQSELLSSRAQRQRLLVATLIEINSKTLQPSKQFREAATNILCSALNGVLGEKVLEFVVELVLKWVFTAPPHAEQRYQETEDDRKLLFRRLQQFLKRAPEAIIFMASPSVFASYVVPRDDFILKKSVVSSQPPGMLDQCRRPARFVCFSCVISLSTGSNLIELATSTHEELFTAQDATRLFIARYMRCLRDEYHVQLVISTEALDENVIAVCTRQGIACVQLAEPEDVEALCISAGTFPLASVFDKIQAAKHVGLCLNGISRVRFQQHACLRFRGLAEPDNQDNEELLSDDQQREKDVVVPQLLIHASSKGVYKQYYAAIVKSLRVLRSWLELPDAEIATTRSHGTKHSSVVYSCRGGGATELAIVRWLQTSREKNASRQVTSISRQILADALIEVVSALRSTLSKACSVENDEEPASNQLEGGRRRVLLEALSNMKLQDSDKEAQSYGYVLDSARTVNTAAGPIQIPELVFADPADYGLVHPWRRIDTLLFLMLQTLEQLFRIDMIFLTSAASRPAEPCTT